MTLHTIILHTKATLVTALRYQFFIKRRELVSLVPDGTNFILIMEDDDL